MKNLKLINFVKGLDTKKIYALGCVYEGKNWASKVIKWGAKKEGYEILLSHSALAVYDTQKKEWLALEVVGTGYKETELKKFINEYQGQVYYGAFKEMLFEDKYNYCLQAFKQFQEENKNKYSTIKAVASFIFTKKPYTYLNWILKIANKKAQKETGAFCSEIAFKVLLNTAFMQANVNFSEREKIFLNSKKDINDNIDFTKIYPAEMQNIFEMKIINKI